MNIKLMNAYSRTYTTLNYFKEILSKPHCDLKIDACARRLQLTFDLLLRLLKEILEDGGYIDFNSLKHILSKAYTDGLIEDEQAWLQMLDDRNNRLNTYNLKLAEEIFSRIPQHYTLMQTTFDELCKKFNVSKETLEQESKRFN